MTELRCITCREEPRAWVVYVGRTLCVECAALRYDAIKDVRLQAAWLLVRGKELDNETKGGYPPYPEQEVVNSVDKRLAGSLPL